MVDSFLVVTDQSLQGYRRLSVKSLFLMPSAVVSLLNIKIPMTVIQGLPVSASEHIASMVRFLWSLMLAYNSLTLVDPSARRAVYSGHRPGRLS